MKRVVFNKIILINCETNYNSFYLKKNKKVSVVQNLNFIEYAGLVFQKLIWNDVCGLKIGKRTNFSKE